MSNLIRGFLGLLLFVLSSAAQSELLKPMMLAYTKPGADVAAEANLSAGKGGVHEVYRIDIPGRDVTLIGVAIREEEGAERNASDHFHLATVDVGDRRHTAYLPYEILVDGGRVEALHMRFRMALHFPDLSMMGDNSFMQLRRSPAAVEKALTEAANGV